MPSGPLHPPSSLPADLDVADVRAALDGVLGSRAFSTSERLRRFLAHVVAETLEGRASRLKEYSLGTEVCDRPADFDPRADPVVRVEARRLRARLADYYATEGGTAPVVIEVPKGGYVPVFKRREASGTEPPTAAEPAGPPRERHDSPGNGAHAVQSDGGTVRRRVAPGPAVWLAVAAVAAGAALVAWMWERPGRPPTEHGPTGVAVLPFQNASAAPDNDLFCFGLVEDLTGALAQIHGLRVVARTSAEQFRGAQDLSQVGVRLHVRYVVEGSVRRDGRRLRVAARLVDTGSGTPVWGSTFDRDLDDAFRVQSELAGAIAGALSRLVGTPGHALAGPAARPPRPDAYAAYLKGQFLFRTQPGDHAQAIGYLAEATASDPDYAPAHLELAAIRASLALAEVSPPPDLVAQARRDVERALALDPRLADALALRAWLRFFNDWDWAGAEEGFEDALALNPSSSVAHHRYALHLMTAGRFDRAIEHCRAAMDLDPLSYRLVNGCAVVNFCARRPAEAERLTRASIELAPGFPLAHTILGSALATQGRLDEAIAAYEAALAAGPGDPDALASLGQALALGGRTSEARDLLARLDAPGGEPAPSRYEVAFLLAALGQPDRAFDQLEVSLARHETELVYLAVDPLFDPLRRDPRFARLLARVGIPR